MAQQLFALDAKLPAPVKMALGPKYHEAETFEAELAAQGLSFFKQKPIPNDRYHRRIVESWNRIFDLKLVRT